MRTFIAGIVSAIAISSAANADVLLTNTAISKIDPYAIPNTFEVVVPDYECPAAIRDSVITVVEQVTVAAGMVTQHIEADNTSAKLLFGRSGYVMMELQIECEDI